MANLYKHNSSGYTGVSFEKDRKKYRSYIHTGTKGRDFINLGRHTTILEAINARNVYIRDNNLPQAIQYYQSKTENLFE